MTHSLNLVAHPEQSSPMPPLFGLPTRRTPSNLMLPTHPVRRCTRLNLTPPLACIRLQPTSLLSQPHPPDDSTFLHPPSPPMATFCLRTEQIPHPPYLSPRVESCLRPA